MKYKFSISQIFIGLSLIGMLLVQFIPHILAYGFDPSSLRKGEYLNFFLQTFISQFLHGNIFHFFFNAIFIYYFGSLIELSLGEKKYILFFIFIAFFEAILFSTFVFDNSITIGISGFCMAIISYYTIEQKDRGNPDWKGGITAILINITIGFYPGISLYGHLFGALGGIIFYYLNKEWYRRKMVGAIDGNMTA